VKAEGPSPGEVWDWGRRGRPPAGRGSIRRQRSDDSIGCYRQCLWHRLCMESRASLANALRRMAVVREHRTVYLTSARQLRSGPFLHCHWTGSPRSARLTERVWPSLDARRAFSSRNLAPSPLRRGFFLGTIALRFGLSTRSVGERGSRLRPPNPPCVEVGTTFSSRRRNRKPQPAGGQLAGGSVCVENTSYALTVPSQAGRSWTRSDRFSGRGNRGNPFASTPSTVRVTVIDRTATNSVGASRAWTQRVGGARIHARH
jgi:hypothetical protein